MYSVAGGWSSPAPGGSLPLGTGRFAADGAGWFAADGGSRRAAVGAAEDHAALDGVQLGQPPALLGRGEIPLQPGLERAARAAAGQRAGQGPLGALTRRVQQAVQHVHVRLLLADRIRGACGHGIGLARRHIS